MLLNFCDSFYLLRKHSFSLSTFSVNVCFSLGRICCENIFSTFYIPKCNNSAVDGYGVKIRNIRNASIENKIFLKVSSFFEGSFFDDFTVVEIMTGGKVPFNFDAVIKVEDVVSVSFNDFTYIIVSKFLVKNDNIKFIGEDFFPNYVLCKKNEVVALQVITVLSSFGFCFIRIFFFPKIAFFSTGDEIHGTVSNLVGVKDNFLKQQVSIFTTEVNQIFNSTAAFILNFFKQLDIIVDYYGYIYDDIACLMKCFENILENGYYHIILSTGAVSKGKHDFIRLAFLKKGGEVIFHGLKIKPGKPLLFGVFSENCVFFGLPGNVLASIFCIRFFVFYFILQCFCFKNCESFFSFFLSKKKNWKNDFLYFLKTKIFKIFENYYSISVFDQEFFKINSLLTINSFSFFHEVVNNEKSVIETYCLYPVLYGF